MNTVPRNVLAGESLIPSHRQGFSQSSMVTAPTVQQVDDAPDQVEDSGEYIDVVEDERLSFGDIIADRVTREIGSWRFILFYFALLLLWMVLNTVAWVRQWDPYPFIFLNLVLSFQGAFAAPIILMSQNRQEEKARIEERRDHSVNIQAEQVVEAMQARIEELGSGALVEIASLRNGQQALQVRLDTVLELLKRDMREEVG